MIPKKVLREIEGYRLMRDTYKTRADQHRGSRNPVLNEMVRKWDESVKRWDALIAAKIAGYKSEGNH